MDGLFAFGGDAHDLGDDVGGIDVIARRRARRAVARRCRSRARSRPRSARRPPGWAQPLAQPETWMAAIFARGGSCGAISVASARAAISPDAQAGLPGQATMLRRGSSARTTKPRPLGRGRRARPHILARAPSNKSARPGAGRRALHAVRRRQHAGKLRERSAWAWPNASATPSATRAVPQRMAADRLGRWPRRQIRRGGRSSHRRAERKAPIPSVAKNIGCARLAALLPRSRRAAGAPHRGSRIGRDRSERRRRAGIAASATWRRGAWAVPIARSRTSAASASRCSRPPPSTTTETLGASARPRIRNRPRAAPPPGRPHR